MQYPATHLDFPFLASVHLPRRTTWRCRCTWLYVLVAWISIQVGLHPLRAGDDRDDAEGTNSSESAAVSVAVPDLTAQANAIKKEQYSVADRLLQDFPDNFHAWRVMGFVHSSHGNQDEMFRCWQECLRLEPKRADVYDQLGRYATQVEQFAEAIEYWRQALQIDPRFPGIQQRMGFAMLSLGQTDNAIETLQREIALDPQASQAHYLLGEAYFQKQEFEKARSSYQAAVRLEPKHSRAYYGLVKTCTRLRLNEEAANYAKEFQRLEAAVDQSDQVVRRQYDDLRQMREKLAITCVDAGRLYYETNDTRRAEQLWIKAAASDAKNVDSRVLLGTLHSKAGQSAKALKQYEELARIQPNNIDHYQQMGFLQARLGNLAAAESALKQMLKIDPRDAAGHRALAKFYLNTKQQPTAALELAATSVKLQPVADGYFVLGWANAQNGKKHEAVAALEEAIRLAPNNPTYRKLYELVQKGK